MNTAVMTTLDHGADAARLAAVQTGCTVLLLPSPSGAGKDTIINRLEVLGISHPCRRDTTRPTRPGDNGHYRHIDPEEFADLMKQGYYLLPNQFGGYWYGIPVEEIDRLWASGSVPVLKGPVTLIPDAKERLRSRSPTCRILTVYLLTEPEDAWIQVLHERGLCNVDDRIRDSRVDLEHARNAYRGHIDAFVTNRFGELEQTVDRIVNLLRGA